LPSGTNQRLVGLPPIPCCGVLRSSRPGELRLGLMTADPPQTPDGEPVRIEAPLCGGDIERLVIVAGDLEYLSQLPTDRLLTHTEVRLCAGILRRLLIDDELGLIWSRIGGSAGHHLTVVAPEIDTNLNDLPEHWVRLAWAGGAKASHAEHTGFILLEIPKAEHEQYGSAEAAAHYARSKVNVERRSMTVDGWLRSTAVAIKTNQGLFRISRRRVIQHLANRKGGVHFDPRRNLELRNPRKRRKEAEDHLLDHGLLRVGHLSGPEYEITAMAQTIAATDWSPQFIREGERLAPPDFHGDPRELKFWSGDREADGTGWATFTYGPSEDA
jgi:hypothetical protein